MKIRPVNTRDFLIWFAGRLCHHPADKMVLHEDPYDGHNIICLNCSRVFKVSRDLLREYAKQFVTVTEEIKEKIAGPRQ